jgi:hypothetical protein
MNALLIAIRMRKLPSKRWPRLGRIFSDLR